MLIIRYLRLLNKTNTHFFIIFYVPEQLHILWNCLTFEDVKRKVLRTVNRPKASTTAQLQRNPLQLTLT